MSATQKPLVFITYQAQGAVLPENLDILCKASAVTLVWFNPETQKPNILDEFLKNSLLGDKSHTLVAFDVSGGDMVTAAHRHQMEVVRAGDTSAWDILRRAQMLSSII